MIRPKQINLRELFSVQDVLKSKGFSVSSIGNGSDLLIEIPYEPYTNHDILFEAFNEVESRQDILNKIKDASYETTNQYAIRVIEHADFVADLNRYTRSFEWYVGELMIRRFSSFSASYGIKISKVFRRSSARAQPGDYDAIAVTRDINLVYFECKTGSFNKDKVLKCIERSVAIHCEICILFSKNALRFNSIRDIFKGLVHPIMTMPKLNKFKIKGNSTIEVYEWGNCFLIDASKDVEEQVEMIMRINAARKAGVYHFLGLTVSEYDSMGYENEVVNL